MQLSELEAALQTLVGERVVAKTMAHNSISLWFSVQPRQPDARRIWIDPPWRIENDGQIESSSYGFPTDKEDEETDAQYRTRFEQACAKSDCVNGSSLTAVSVNSLTSDLTLQFNDGRILRIFAVDLGYENWHFTDHSLHKRYGVSVAAVDIEGIDA